VIHVPMLGLEHDDMPVLLPYIVGLQTSLLYNRGTVFRQRNVSSMSSSLITGNANLYRPLSTACKH